MVTRAGSPTDLTDRHRALVAAVAELHLRDSRPVGSKALADHLGGQWSPATIRAELAELCERGYLTQPHTSAGRVPTSVAWRELARDVAARRRSPSSGPVAASLRAALGTGDRGTLLGRACHLLAARLPYVGVVVAPPTEAAVLSRLEFVALEGRRVLAVLLTRGGRVHHRAVSLDFDVTRSDLEQFHNYLNTWMAGLTLTQIRDRIGEELERDRAAADRVVRAALLAGRKALEDGLDEGDVLIEGRTRILEMADFESLEKVRPVLLALERKEGWLRLLERSIEAGRAPAARDAASAAAGGVLRLDIDARALDGGLEECSVVTASWRSDGETGAIGVVGPVRMDYARVIPLVEIAAATLTEALAL